LARDVPAPAHDVKNQHFFLFDAVDNNALTRGKTPQILTQVVLAPPTDLRMLRE
jgi:hypothetical protein